ncbi:MAG: hypothetical protein R3A49_00880 [Acidimicrobiia bacterium]
MTGPDTRVRDVQRQVRPTFLLAVVFAASAVVVAVVPHDTGVWLPLHLFLVGSLLLAISGASLLFAVTWSAAPAPARHLVVAQRLLLSAGAAGLAITREMSAPGAATVAAAAVVAALALLGVMLVTVTAAGRNRRFDAPVGNYVLALVAGVVGCTMGALLVLEPRSTGFRAGHVAVNLLGLVGIVIAATLPFFSATEARTKMSPRATATGQRLLGGILALSLTVAIVGLLGEATAVTGTALVVYALALVFLVALLPRLRAKQFRWAGPRLVGLLAGIAWWVSAVITASVHAFDGSEVFTRPVLMALVVGGYTQILLSSLAYLGPVLRGGGHETLTAGFRTTRSWIALCAVNAAAAALTAGFLPVGWVLLAATGLDAATRTVTLVTGPRGSTFPGTAPSS